MARPAEFSRSLLYPHALAIPCATCAGLTGDPVRVYPAKKMRILVIEDDAVLSQTMTRSLEQAGHRVDLACSVDEANHCWHAQVFDAVLLDLNLPLSHECSGLGSGLTVLRAARARGDRTPVLVLTARDRTEERIAGLDAGADDYLGKPFDLGEVEARLRALVRRASGTGDRVEIGALVLDRQARRFFLCGQAWDLPAREFEVLCELMTPPGRVVSKRDLSRKLSTPRGPWATTRS